MNGAATSPSVEFRRERQRSWRELEKLVERVERDGLGALSEADLLRLPALHRAAVSGLSVARAISLDKNLLEYLEALTARSYFCVYGVRRRPLAVLFAFAARDFPRAVRRAAPQVGLSALFLLLGVLAGFALTALDLDRYYSFVDPGLAAGRDPAATDSELLEPLYADEFSAPDTLANFASFLFSHNAQVSILCFALGFAAGIPVFYLLFTNGLMLGAMSALHHARGLGLDWWGWVLPHGVTELTALVLCGGAGLLQARALLFPGRSTRLASLAAAGREAAVIVVGACALLFLSALIEGFFRQLVHSIEVRYALVASSALACALYFTCAGRKGAT